MATAGPVAADESTWEMPDAWRRVAHPRRDRPGPWPPARVDAAAVGRARALVEAARAASRTSSRCPARSPSSPSTAAPT
ncbi:hypothetical protein ACFQY7_19825 [Actinomadura luteofluorescens]|uniref:hypothetical protein n=1 Tax=Actinomadura luteofluorescens TaxID=46163 RepID=UPI00363C2D43